MKEKIALSKTQETLLITIRAKAFSGKPFFYDPKAEEILTRLDYDFALLRSKRGTDLTICMRAKKIDETVQLFLQDHPDGIVLHLGCGLDSRCERVKHPRAHWYDLDLPEVIELRQKFYSEHRGYHMIASSVTDMEWMDQVLMEGKPVIAAAEGLLMYLPETEVKQLILKLQTSFPGIKLVFDAYSTLTAQQAHRHPGLKKTGASIFWGIDNPLEIEAWGGGIKLEEEWYYSQSPDISQLGFLDRLLFNVFGRFKVVNRAHRILIYQL